MPSRDKRYRRAVRRARRFAQTTKIAAQLAASVERTEERCAAALAAAGVAEERGRALLIINAKSGPNEDSLLHARALASKLRALGIDAEIKVKVKKVQARRDARRAADEGLPLVIAAGGDGTVEAVAAGLAGTDCVLGIIPLGTYNNVATSLGVPSDIDAACALIAAGPVRAIDVGRVIARGMKRPRLFLEMGAIGLVAALMPVGQDVEKGRWTAGARALPVALAHV